MAHKTCTASSYFISPVHSLSWLAQTLDCFALLYETSIRTMFFSFISNSYDFLLFIDFFLYNFEEEDTTMKCIRYCCSKVFRLPEIFMFGSCFGLPKSLRPVYHRIWPAPNDNDK